MINGALVQVLCGDHVLDHVFFQLRSNLLVSDVRVVLCRDDYGVHSDRPHSSVFLEVLHSDLCLSVRSHPGTDALLAHLGESVAQSGGQGVGQGHALRSLVGGVAEHVSLVAGSYLLDRLVLVHCLGDFCALLLYRHHHLAGAVVQAFLYTVVADLLDGITHHLLEVYHGCSRDLSKYHHEIGLRTTLAGHVRFGVLRETGVEDCV